MIVDRPDQYLGPDVFIRLDGIVQHRLAIKCEGFNFAWSIKLRTARYMVDAAERAGAIGPGTTLVESSSGNLGVALAVIAASRSMQFLCVTDPNCNAQAVALMRATGASVEVVRDRDDNGSYLGARKRRVAELDACHPGHVWLNQYENPANVRAHYDTTAAAIAAEFPDLDVLFIGAGTGGTLMGCLEYFTDHAAGTRVVAVDSVGSVNFHGPPSARYIAGLGASEPMALIDEERVQAVEWVQEQDSVRMCRRLARSGIVLGGSSGTVVQGACAWLDRHDPTGRLTGVAVAPDFGLSYLDTVYDDAWCALRFPDLGDKPDELGTGRPVAWPA